MVRIDSSARTDTVRIATANIFGARGASELFGKKEIEKEVKIIERISPMPAANARDAKEVSAVP